MSCSLIKSSSLISSVFYLNQGDIYISLIPNEADKNIRNEVVKSQFTRMTLFPHLNITMHDILGII